MMIKVNSPAILIAGTTTAFVAFAHNYNKGKKLKECIRREDICYFEQLVKASAINLLYYNLPETDIESVPPLIANNNLLLNLVDLYHEIELNYSKPSEFTSHIRTIKKRIKWLEELQAISTKQTDNRGFVEISISPNLLFLYNAKTLTMQHPACFTPEKAAELLNKSLDYDIQPDLEQTIYLNTLNQQNNDI